jgi:hypothetical protein
VWSEEGGEEKRKKGEMRKQTRNDKTLNSIKFVSQKWVKF